jgi:hypothetical protein
MVIRPLKKEGTATVAKSSPVTAKMGAMLKNSTQPLSAVGSRFDPEPLNSFHAGASIERAAVRLGHVAGEKPAA